MGWFVDPEPPDSCKKGGLPKTTSLFVQRNSWEVEDTCPHPNMSVNCALNSTAEDNLRRTQNIIRMVREVGRVYCTWVN